MTPTPEQEAVVKAISTSKDNLLIECPAGGAKTTLLVLACAKMYPQPLLALAFNKRNADDLVKRLPQWVTCKTFNALGHAVWAKTSGHPRLNLDTRKIGKLVSEYVSANRMEDEAWDAIRQLVDAARNAGAIPRGIAFQHTFGTVLNSSIWEELAFSVDVQARPEFTSAAEEILIKSILAAYSGTIDFSDQIYMSVCFGGVFPKFATVMVDEAQDLSPMNQEMLARSCAGRLIAVGDRYQGIYAFRGADSQSIQTLIERFHLVPLSADTSFRCPKAVCEVARKRHPRIVPFHTNPEGSVTRLEEWSTTSLKDHSVVLCRNNAPLIGLAFKLIRSGRGVKLLGGDLSKGLNKILSGLGPDTTERLLALQAISQWENRESTTAAGELKGAKLVRINDKAECLRACFAAGVETIGEAKAFLTRIFNSDSGLITLSTGHKSKGFEWKDVYILDPWRTPSRQAREAERNGNFAPMEQEKNLQYVMATRAMENLYYINMENLQ